MLTNLSNKSIGLSHHKFQAPLGEQKQVLRSELLARISKLEATQCVVIQAPAGHGKTTLLKQILSASRADGKLTAWLKIDETDNDLNRLLLHLDKIAGDLEESHQAQHAAALKENSLPKGRAERFNNRLAEIGTEIHLFIDDFQFIEEPEIELLFRHILKSLPNSVRIFIASRSLPKIGLTELQVVQRLELLRFEEIKFSLQETKDFFQIEHQLSLSDDDLSIIYNRSEGWAAALQLFRLTLAKRSVKDSLNNLESYTPFQITEYLASNVLQQQATDTQDFLLYCSLLPKICASLCEKITGRKDSQETLEKLEHQGLFLNNIDNENHWFQFHRLFSDYLKEVLRKRSPTRCRQIHNDAARWFLEHELYEDALFHAVEAQDFELATHSMDIWATDQITSACLHSVERWAEKIPLQHIFDRPSLIVKITWALTFLRRRAKVLPYLDELKKLGEKKLDWQFSIERQITMAVVEMALDHLDQAFENVANIKTENHEARGFWAFELGAAANIQACRRIAYGNFSAARYHIAVGRNHNHGDSAPFLAGYNTGLTIISSYLQGSINEAYERSISVLKTKGLNIEESYAATAAVCCTLFPLYEKNDFDTAIKVFEQYHQEINTGLLPDFVSAAYLPMIRIYDVKGERSKARELLDTLEDIAISANWPRIIQLCNWEHIRRELLSDSSQKNMAISKSTGDAELNFEAPPFLSFSDALENPSIARLRLEIHTCPTDETSSKLQDAIQQAQSHNLIPREIKLHILNAILNINKGNSAQSSSELKTAMTLAAEYGVVRSILDEGPKVIQLLKSHLNGSWSSTLNHYIKFLLSHCEETVDISETETELLEALTSREMQILSLLAKGETNKNIARNLFVSENTVKFHLKNIFNKLNVSTRTQAINNATMLGLI
ncbi:LuxR C-terminal-related transcriptional regulator [Zhongshania aliphaticivorans]|uniref:LuxR C-terminal-related transcriptional regulator n=1 Tax=Zhongshania aliphaticivorans TaxID=1470434 RepID=UPI0012E4C99D|nr:LuxR C-terminal-related transcriptional regulator [Zhongshania aliphaticivorans]CAA0097898.1 HTH-type transcriptional regulator MalT [Zhongshania aliphaticivorans]